MDRPKPFITSVRVDGNGVHDFVTIFIRGQNVGTLCCGKGDGQPLAELLERDLPKTEADAIAWHELERRAAENRAADEELTRRGLDWRKMNEGRAARGMPKLSASEMLARLDAAAAPPSKPPLGVMPEWLWREQRIKALSEAILARGDAARAMSPQWAEELETHRRWLAKQHPPMPAEVRTATDEEQRQALERDAAHYETGGEMRIIRQMRRRIDEARALLGRCYGGALRVDLAKDVRDWLKNTPPFEDDERIGIKPCPCGAAPRPGHPQGWCDEGYDKAGEA